MCTLCRSATPLHSVGCHRPCLKISHIIKGMVVDHDAMGTQQHVAQASFVASVTMLQPDTPMALVLRQNHSSGNTSMVQVQL